MRSQNSILASLTALALLPTAASAAIISGNLNVTQIDDLNNATSVSASFGYTSGQISYSGGSRGDFGIRFDGATPADDVANGIMIVSMSENGRSNEFGGIGAGLGYATPAIQSGAGGYATSINVSSTSVSGIAGGGEWNANHAVGYFKYSDFLGGWATNSVNNGALTSFVGSSSSLTLGSGETNPGTFSLFDPTTTGGYYSLNMTNLKAPGTGAFASSQNGILLVVGGRNEDNYALSSANADGTFTIICKDNGDDAAGAENDGVGFVYIPVGQPGVSAMGRVDGDGNVSVASGNFTVELGNTGEWYIYTPGLTADNSTLLISPEGSEASGTLRGDNIWSYAYDAVNGRWVVQGRDIPGSETGNPGLQSLPGEPAFSFIVVPEPSTGLLALGGLGLALRRRRK